MRRIGLLVAGAGLLFLASGCATTRNTSLENRVQILESKMQSMEGTGENVSLSIPSEGREESSSVSADSMTKKQIQMALRNAGYYDGSVDGKIGPKTKAAVKKFQSDMGLKADGIAGKNTREKLVKYLP